MEDNSRPDGTPSEIPRDLLKRILREMRQEKPHFHVVFNAFVKHGDIWLRSVRADRFSFEYQVFHGFLAELGRKLGITPNAVKYRLRVSLGWFIQRARRIIDEGEQPTL